MAQTFLATAASSWAVLMGIAPVLQIRNMLRQRSSREVSITYFAVLLVGFLLWIAYGAAAGLLALVIPNIVALLIGTTVVIVALRLRPGFSAIKRVSSARDETTVRSQVDLYSIMPVRDRTKSLEWFSVFFGRPADEV